MNPLLLYLGVLALCILVGVLAWAFRNPPKRKCPLCDADVEVGKAHCHSCGYRFTAARY